MVILRLFLIVTLVRSAWIPSKRESPISQKDLDVCGVAGGLSRLCGLHRATQILHGTEYVLTALVHQLLLTMFDRYICIPHRYLLPTCIHSHQSSQQID